MPASTQRPAPRKRQPEALFAGELLYLHAVDLGDVDRVLRIHRHGGRVAQTVDALQHPSVREVRDIVLRLPADRSARTSEPIVVTLPRLCQYLEDKPALYETDCRRQEF